MENRGTEGLGLGEPHWFAGCGMLVAGGFCYRMLSDESSIARESQNSPAPARASDRLLSIWRFLVPKPSFAYRHTSSLAKGCAGPARRFAGRAFMACSASRRSSRDVIFRLIGEPGTTVTC